MSLICPQVYACNSEGLIFPVSLFKAGNICSSGVMTSTAIHDRIYSIGDEVAREQTCKTGMILVLRVCPYIFFGKDMCCQGAAFKASYIESIGSEIDTDDIFSCYGYSLNSSYL